MISIKSIILSNLSFVNSWSVHIGLISLKKCRQFHSTGLLTVCFYHLTYKFKSESTLYSLPKCQGTPFLKQVPDLKFKWKQRDSNPQQRGIESCCCHWFVA